MQPPHHYPRANLYLALGCIAFAALLAFVWIPQDTGSGLVIKQRGRLSVGDGLAPTLAAAMIGLGGLLVLLQPTKKNPHGISHNNILFLLRFLATCAIAIILMRWVGPACISLTNWASGGDLEYRLLRDTAPWKYLGYVVGGTFLTAALIATVEGKLSWRTVVISLLAVCTLIALYDVPFDDLQLPPNGDV